MSRRGISLKKKSSHAQTRTLSARSRGFSPFKNIFVLASETLETPERATRDSTRVLMAAIPPDGATASHEATRPASKDVAVGVPGRRTQRSDTWHWQAPRRNQPHDTPGRGELLGPDEEKGTGREEIRQPAAGQPGPALRDCVMTDTTAPISREESTAGVVREGETSTACSWHTRDCWLVRLLFFPKSAVDMLVDEKVEICSCRGS